MTFKRVGAIGGGQLAWMMAGAANKLKLEFNVQTPHKDDPAVKVANKVVLAPIADTKATTELAQYCDVITFENEFIDLVALHSLAESGIYFAPSLTALKPLLDKYHQRQYLQSIGLPVPKFTLVKPNAPLKAEFGYPAVLKARRHGYDGRGTFLLSDRDALESTWNRLERPSMLLEEYIPFERELAIVAARNSAGEVVCYPVVETKQKEQVCRWTIAPANIFSETIVQIEAIARTILNKLEVVGIFGIELFLTAKGKILVNEIAPRTHNSGHYTLDGCDISQFEMHLRAVTGLPMPHPQLQASTTVMVNLLGAENSQSDYTHKRTQLARLPQTFVHWYGKTVSRPGRKMGHVNALLNSKSPDEIERTIARIESIWYE